MSKTIHTPLGPHANTCIYTVSELQYALGQELTTELWVEQFPRIELQPKMKEANRNYSGNLWTRRTEKV